MVDDLSMFDDDDETDEEAPLLGMAKLADDEEKSRAEWEKQRLAARADGFASPEGTGSITDNLIDQSLLDRLATAGSSSTSIASPLPSDSDSDTLTHDDSSSPSPASNEGVDLSTGEQHASSRVFDDDTTTGVSSPPQKSPIEVDGDASPDVESTAKQSSASSDPFGDLVDSVEEDDEEFDPDSFEDESEDAFVAGELDEEDANEELDDEVLAQVVEEEDEELLRQDQEEFEEYQRSKNIPDETSLDGATERAKAHVGDILTVPRNPAPMTQDETRIDEDRPMSRLNEPVEPDSTKLEALTMSGKEQSIKLPVALVDTIRAVAVQSLLNTTFELSARQIKQVRGHIGSKKYDAMSDKEQRMAWVDFVNTKVANNRIVVAFLAAQANLDIEGLDDTTAMLVSEMRRVDPVLRELHTNTSRLDAMIESERMTRELNNEMLQTLKELELAAAFMVGWTTIEGSKGVATTRPSQLNIATTTTKIVRDRLQLQTKKDLTDIKRRQGMPID